MIKIIFLSLVAGFAGGCSHLKISHSAERQPSNQEALPVNCYMELADKGIPLAKDQAVTLCGSH